MSITITVPSDTHVVGDTGHTPDHNTIVDAITTLGADAANTAGDTFTGAVVFNNSITLDDTSQITSSGYIGKDAITYGPLGRKIAFASGQAVSSTSNVAITGLTVPVGIGTYRFRFQVNMKANASAGQWLYTLSGPTTSTLNYMYRYISAAGAGGVVGNIAAYTADVIAGPATSVTGFYWLDIEGQIVTTATGNLALNGRTTVGADTFNVFVGSNLELSLAA